MSDFEQHVEAPESAGPAEAADSKGGFAGHGPAGHGPKGGPADKGDNERIMRMGHGNIPKLVLEFAIPAIVGMVVNAAYQIIDSIFLGQGVGELGLSTMTVVSPIMTIIMGLTMLIGAGGNALCALRLGEGKHREAEHILGNTFTLGMVISVIVAILMHLPFVVDPLLTFSSTTEDVRPFARTFLQIISLGCALSIVGAGINNFIRTAGDPNRALTTMVIGAVGCTFFNWLFVMVLGWGIVGSAWATIAGQAMSCVSVLWYFIKTPGVPLRLRREHLPLNPKLGMNIMTLGLPSFIMQIGASASMLVCNFVLVKYGSATFLGADGALAISGVVGRIAMFIVMPLIGMSIAVQPLLGFNYGAKLWWRVRKTLFVGVGAATIIGTTLWALLLIFAAPVVTIFGITDPEELEFAAAALRVGVITIPIVGAQIIGSNYFQATGQPTKSIVLSLTRQILFLIPCYLILPEVMPLIVPGVDSLKACFAAMPASDALAFFVTGIFVLVELRKINARIKENPEASGMPKFDPAAKAEK